MAVASCVRRKLLHVHQKAEPVDREQGLTFELPRLVPYPAVLSHPRPCSSFSLFSRFVDLSIDNCAFVEFASLPSPVGPDKHLSLCSLDSLELNGHSSTSVS